MNAWKDIQTRGTYRLCRDAIKCIMGRVGVRQNDQLAVFFFGEKNIVVGIKLLNRSRKHTQPVFKTHNKIDGPLALVKGFQIPYEVFIIIRDTHMRPL